MKKQLAILALLLPCYSYSLVQWNNAGVPANVTNDDLEIVTSPQLAAGTTTISATVSDIDITLDKDITLRGNDAGQSTLVFNAEAGRTITVHLDESSLRLRGSNNNLAWPLIVRITGEGTVIFDIEEGERLDLGSTNTAGATSFYVVFDGTTSPQVIFRQHDEEGVVLGRRSNLGFEVAGVGVSLVQAMRFELVDGDSEDDSVLLRLKDGSGIDLNVT